jgi:GT2 family glycosyltransferase
MADAVGLPVVTVVVATRDRPHAAARAVELIVANHEPRLEVVVVDQSSDGATEASLQSLLADPRVRYLRSASIGLSSARNQAIAEARSDFVALTDDDCAVPVDWAARMVAALSAAERVALVFGNVLPAPHDGDAGFIPGYVRNEPFMADSVDHMRAVEGIGACMGLRRAAWSALGGFDEMLGAGARFPAADEGDLAIRALAAGWHVYETPDVWVTHHGFRTTMEARALVGVYARGTGAMMAKHVRCRTPRATRLLADMAWHWTRGGLHPAARVGDGRHRLVRLTAFAGGFLAGVAAPVDRRARLFAGDGRDPLPNR